MPWISIAKAICVLLSVALLLLVATPTEGSLAVYDVFPEPIEGANPNNCFEYQYRVELADDVTMYYVMTEELLSVSMVFDTEAWVSFGVTPEEKKGEMIGGEAIIGLPLEPVSETNPGKYTMTSFKVAGVNLRDASDQTLIDATVVQEDGETILQFSKKLQEDAEVEILAQGKNYFMWAYGYQNKIGLHDYYTGTGAFLLDTSDQPPCVQVDTPAPTESTSAPTSAPTEPPTKAPSPAPTSAPSDEVILSNEESPSPSPSLSPVDQQQEVDCSEYQQTFQLDDKLKLSYVVNLADQNNEESTISVKMEFEGEAWISLGVAENADAKMVGSEAIIALPDQPVGYNNPGEYHMTSQLKDGVSLMSDDKQTLMNGDILQENGVTTMLFTKILSEPGKLPLNGNGVNTFMWAYGFSNSLNLHEKWGAFTVKLTPCSVEGTNVSESNDSFKTVSSSNLTDEQRRRMWKAHAWLGLLAWALFCPVSIAISRLRSLLQKWGGLWFKIHMYLNVLVFFCTVIGFFLAVILYQDEDKEHFVGTHEAMGLALTILVTFQAGGGIFRPSIPKSDVKEDKDVEEEMSASISDGTDPPSPARSSQGKPSNDSSSQDLVTGVAVDDGIRRKKVIRTAWEQSHKLIGAYLLIFGLWQVQDGIILYSNKFGTKDYTRAFWIYIGVAATLFWILMVYVKVRDVR